MIAALISDNVSLTSINLSGSNLTDFGRDMTGIKAIADALVMTSATQIDLSNNCLMNEGAKALAPAIAVNASLASVCCLE